MKRGFDGARIVSGNGDGAFSLRIVLYDHPSIGVGTSASSSSLPKIGGTSQIKQFPSSGLEAALDHVDTN